MGLAATQARFLAITSRKASCEFRSMELAQQKLSLSREMQTATEEYQDSLNATRLIWDADGTGDYRYNLSYSLMMNPSDLNQYTPYMLSRTDGKIAVDDKMRQALSEYFNITEDPTTGIISSDGGIKYNGTIVYRGDDDYEAAAGEAFITFIEGLEENRGMSGAVADKIRDVDSASGDIYYKYIEDAGLGGELVGREEANVMTINSVLSYVDYIIENVQKGYFSAGSDEAEFASKLIFDFDNALSNGGSISGKSDYSCHLNTSWNSKNGSTELLLNGDYLNNVTYSDETNKLKNSDGSKMVGVSQYSTRAFTLSDLLNEDVTLLVTGQQSYNNVLEIMESALSTTSVLGTSALINKDVNVWYNELAGDGAYENMVAKAKTDACSELRSQLAILNYFDKLAKSMYTLFMPKDSSAKDENAFYTALQDTISSFRNNIQSGSVKSWVDIGPKWDISSEALGKAAVRDADKYNSWVKSGNQWAISLSNLTEACLTNFINGMDDYGDGCLIAQKASASTYITDNPNYLYTVNVIDENLKNGMWESEFYSIIFNNLCSSGWYLNEQVSDETYLANALKNGQLFVVSKGNDDYFYQSRYAQAYGGHISQETDETAIALAEREYLYKKSKINYKEEQIEVESKNVDAELSALTTEYETVKNMITKNVDKTFKMFQS